MMVSRRKLIVGIGAVMAAPAIVRASSIMPVKSLDDVHRIDWIPAVGWPHPAIYDCVSVWPYTPPRWLTNFAPPTEELRR